MSQEPPVNPPIQELKREFYWLCGIGTALNIAIALAHLVDGERGGFLSPVSLTTVAISSACTAGFLWWLWQRIKRLGRDATIGTDDRGTPPHRVEAVAVQAEPYEVSKVETVEDKDAAIAEDTQAKTGRQA